MKNILITGAAKRLGRYTAIHFAKLGYNIALHYHNSESEAKLLCEELSYLGIDAQAFKADLRNSKEIKKLFLDINSYFGNLDILINNAAVFPNKSNLQDISEEKWNNTIDINLKSYLFTSQEFSKSCNNNAKIINIASIGGLEIWDKRLLYNLSKSGVLTLTKALARELAPNIAVNSICPGVIEFWEEPNEIRVLSKDKILFGRYAKPEEVIEVIEFFATCSNYITAQNINVDGGTHNTR